MFNFVPALFTFYPLVWIVLIAVKHFVCQESRLMIYNSFTKGLPKVRQTFLWPRLGEPLAKYRSYMQSESEMKEF
jgi:hypothetical protein